MKYAQLFWGEFFLTTLQTGLMQEKHLLPSKSLSYQPPPITRFCTMTEYQQPISNVKLSRIRTAVTFPTDHAVTFFAENWLEYLVRTPDGWSCILTCCLLFQQHCPGTSHHPLRHLTSYVQKCPNKLRICCHRSDCLMSPILSLEPAFGGGVTQVISAAHQKETE